MRGEVTKCFAYGVDEALGDLDRTGRNDVIDAGAKAWLVSLACQFPEDVPEGPEQDRWTISALTDYVQRHCAAAGYASLENVRSSTVWNILNDPTAKPRHLDYCLECRDESPLEDKKQILLLYKRMELVPKFERDALGTGFCAVEPEGAAYSAVMQAVTLASVPDPQPPGPRQANGEQTARAIAMLPILTGQVGLPGTSTGMEEDGTNWEPTYLPVGTNPIKAQIPVFLWTDAILRGEQMDWIHDGVKGLEEGKKLGHSIKMIVNSGGNTLINQHGDCNWTDKVLRDDSKCEFIVVCDNMMTPSARYADILLPDTLGPETDDICGNGDSMGDLACIYPMHKAVDPAFDQRPNWEICRGIAKELGLEEQYTEGRDQKGWIKWCYEQTRKDNPELPEFDKFWKAGPTQLFNVKWQPIMFKEFREDPVKNPLKTPSGKIEIYSEALANLSKTWVLPKGDVISALPKFVQTFDMPGDKAAKKYPLQCFGYHGHGRTHSTFHNLPWLREVHPDQVLINELDAKARNIADGDKVHVFNDRGCIEVPAHVTKRIMPGVCAVPQGAWYKPVKKDGKTIDVGACINTLTGHRPSPLAKGNPQHSNLVEIRKA